jgi:hypothetical protein
MIIHAITDLSKTATVNFLKAGLSKEATNLENYHPDFSDNPANLFYILKDGRFKHGNYFIMEEDGKYVGSAGWNPHIDIALVLTRAFIPIAERRKYNLAYHLLPLIFEQTLNFKKLWITCNDYNFAIYQGLTRLQHGKSTGLLSAWPPIYKNFVPIGKKIVNYTEQYVAEYVRNNNDLSNRLTIQ